MLPTGADAVIYRDGRYLLLQRAGGKSRPYLWCFPGGKVEPGETGRQAVVREVREETGLTVEAVRLLYTDRNVPGKVVECWECRERATSDPDITLNHEHVGYGWFTIKDLDNMGFVRFLAFRHTIMQATEEHHDSLRDEANAHPD